MSLTRLERKTSAHDCKHWQKLAGARKSTCVLILVGSSLLVLFLQQNGPVDLSGMRPVPLLLSSCMPMQGARWPFGGQEIGRPIIETWPANCAGCMLCCTPAHHWAHLIFTHMTQALNLSLKRSGHRVCVKTLDRSKCQEKS